MKTLVTGASGHIGSNLVRALLAQGKALKVGAYRDSQSFTGLDVERCEIDVLNLDSLTKAMAGVDVVYHLVGRIPLTGASGKLMMRVNVEGVQNTMEAAKRAGVERVVHFASVHAFYYNDLSKPIDESFPLADKKGFSAYERSKALGLMLAKKAADDGLDVVVVCPSAVVGPYDFKRSPMGDLFTRLYLGKLPALVDGGFDFVDARDVAKGAIAACEKGEKGEHYFLTNRTFTFDVLAKLAAEAGGFEAKLKSVPYWLAAFGAPFTEFWAYLRGTPPLYTRESIHTVKGAPSFSHEKAKAAFGYKPRPIERSLEDIYGWFLETGRL